MDRQKFGRLIKDIRKTKGLSQEDVDWLSNISKKTLSRLERGDFKEASISSLIELSKLYGEDILSIYIKSAYHPFFLHQEILSSLDMTCKFMDDKDLGLLSKKLDIVEESREFKNKEEEIKFLRLFIDRLINPSMSKNIFKDRYEDISLKRTNNILSNSNSMVEDRIIMAILNDFGEYRGEQDKRVFTSIIKSDKGTILKSLAFYSKTIEDIKVGCIRESDIKKIKQVINTIKLDKEFNNNENLALFYYLLAVAEKRINDLNYKNSINKSILLAEFVSRKQIYKKINGYNMKYMIDK